MKAKKLLINVFFENVTTGKEYLITCFNEDHPTPG